MDRIVASDAGRKCVRTSFFTRACRAIRPTVSAQAMVSRARRRKYGVVAALDQHVRVPGEAIEAVAGDAVPAEGDDLALGLHAVTEAHPPAPERLRIAEAVAVLHRFRVHLPGAAIVDEPGGDVGAVDGRPGPIGAVPGGP